MQHPLFSIFEINRKHGAVVVRAAARGCPIKSSIDVDQGANWQIAVCAILSAAKEVNDFLYAALDVERINRSAARRTTFIRAISQATKRSDPVKLVIDFN